MGIIKKGWIYLTLISALSAPLKAGAISRERIDGFSKFGQSYERVVGETTNDESLHFSEKLIFNRETENQLKRELNYEISKLTNEIQQDIENGNFHQALNALYGVEKFLESLKKEKKIDVDSEIGQVANLIVNVKDAERNTNKKRNIVAYDFIWNKVDFSRPGVYKYGDIVCGIQTLKVKTELTPRDIAALIADLRMKIILKLGLKDKFFTPQIWYWGVGTNELKVFICMDKIFLQTKEDKVQFERFVEDKRTTILPLRR